MKKILNALYDWFVPESIKYMLYRYKTRNDSSIESGSSKCDELSVSSLGHDFSHRQTKSGYGACKCNARENTDASARPCPENAPLVKTTAKPKKTHRKKKLKK